MADFTLTAFPPGTAVEVFERSDFPAVPLVPQGAPGGRTPVTTGTVDSSGDLALTGLDTGVPYLAYAKVGDVHRYVRFWVAPAEDSPVVIYDSDDAPVSGKRLVVRLDGSGDVDSLEVEDA
ncbi:MAG: hypothetical protein IRZ28_17160 [Steroidobacteraceae bacterium]|nr:hypothetical protein [Steroidobacteraceae bacterium]